MREPRVLELLRRHADVDGVIETPIEGLRLFRVSSPVEPIPVVYPTGICAVAQGQKRGFIGGEVHVYDSRNYLCAAVPMPGEADVPVASAERPVLGAFVSFTLPVVSDLILRFGDELASRPSAGEVHAGLTLAKWDAPFDNALARLVSLLDDPLELRALGESRMRELMFAVLRGGGGHTLNRPPGPAREVARAVDYIRDHLDQHISVDGLAHRARMSRTVFHRAFKATTGHTPIQFVKSLRLNHSAMLIAEGAGVAEAARRVGYSSASQFSREFRREFGSSPSGWKSREPASGSPSGPSA